MYWIPQRTKAHMLINLNSEPLTWVYLHQSRGEDIDYTLLDCNSLMLYQIVSSDVLVLIAKCSPIKVLTVKIFIKRCGIHLLAKMYNNFESVFMINTFINHRHLNIGFFQKRAQHRKSPCSIMTNLFYHNSLSTFFCRIALESTSISSSPISVHPILNRGNGN